MLRTVILVLVAFMPAASCSSSLNGDLLVAATHLEVVLDEQGSLEEEGLFGSKEEKLDKYEKARKCLFGSKEKQNGAKMDVTEFLRIMKGPSWGLEGRFNFKTGKIGENIQSFITLCQFAHSADQHDNKLAESFSQQKQINTFLPARKGREPSECSQGHEGSTLSPTNSFGNFAKGKLNQAGFIKGPLGIDVPRTDEDIPQDFAGIISSAVSNSLFDQMEAADHKDLGFSIVDDPKVKPDTDCPWDNEIGQQMVTGDFKLFMPNQDRIQTEWEHIHVTSDEGIAELSFNHFGAITLEKLGGKNLALEREGWLFGGSEEVKCEKWADCTACTMHDCVWMGAKKCQEKRGMMSKAWNGAKEGVTDALKCPHTALAPQETCGIKMENPAVDKSKITSISGLEDVVYINDLSRGYLLDPRTGLERHGAVLFFSGDKKLVAIYWCHGGVLVFPSAADSKCSEEKWKHDWKHAKFVWASTLGLTGTAIEHLVWTHWVVANRNTLAIQNWLEPTHPIRRLSKPFTFNTVSINAGATATLQPEHQQLHRASGLTYESLQRAFEYGFSSFKFQTFPEWAASKHLEPADSAVVEDGLPLWQIYHDLVSSVVDLYWVDDDQCESAESYHEDTCMGVSNTCVAADAGIQRFWTDLHLNHPRFPYFGKVLPQLTKAKLVDALTFFYFFVSAWHELVGTVMEYVKLPDFLSFKLWPGKNIADPQTYMLTASICSMTGLRMPHLMHDPTQWFKEENKRKQDWTYIFNTEMAVNENVLPKCAHEKVVNIWKDFQTKLTEQAKKVDELNKQRTVPFMKFHPAFLETSVSV